SQYRCAPLEQELRQRLCPVGLDVRLSLRPPGARGARLRTGGGAAACDAGRGLSRAVRRRKAPGYGESAPRRRCVTVAVRLGCAVSERGPFVRTVERRDGMSESWCCPADSSRGPGSPGGRRLPLRTA